MPTIAKTVPYLCAIGLLVLSGCGTPEYRVEKSHCEAEWLLKIPPVYRQETVTRYRREERPTGETICKTEGSTTKCKPVMETASIPYTALETVDIRRAERNPQIKSCAARACAAKYGNSACKI